MHELVAEADRLRKEIAHISRQAPPAAEVPLRIHSHDIDSGGAPEFHPAFLRYLGNTTVCTCGRPAQCAPNCHYAKDRVLGHLDACEPACLPSTRFRPSDHHGSPTRMKRALRQVRALNPKAYDFLYLVVVLHYTFEQAAVKLNSDNLSRGLPERSHADYAVLWVSGSSMLASSF